MFLIKSNFLLNFLKINLCYFKSNKILLFTTTNLIKYYKEVSFIKIYKEKKDYITLNSSWRFLSNFSNFYRNLIFRAKGFLILKGLGLKVKLICNVLEFKLGYSHKSQVNLISEINVKIKKNLIFLQSVNKEKLGNFLFNIKRLKNPDVYKGKGIWYKNEKIALKIVKKK